MLIGLGINDDWSFEEEFYSKRRVPVVAFDGSVGKSEFFRRLVKAAVQVHKPQKALSRFRTIRNYSRFFTDDRRHEAKHVGLSDQPGYVSFSAIIDQARKEKRSRIFFKVDVEGWEYRLLDELIDNASLMTGLAIEFHDIDLHFDKLRDFISRFPLTLVHTHCNNFVICNDKGVPLVIECTFTAFNAGEELVSSLPSGLDMPNNARKEDYQITFYDQLSPVPS